MGQSRAATSSLDKLRLNFEKSLKIAPESEKFTEKIWRTRGDVYFLFLKRKIKFDQLENQDITAHESRLMLKFHEF